MLIPFGLQGGKIYHVENVANGLACDCVCPSCRKPLIAKNKGECKRPHFAHAVDTDCLNYEAMTYLHHYAQQLLEEEQSIFLPEFLYMPEITLIDYSVLRGQIIKLPATKVAFDSIQSEYSWSRYRIDSYGKLKNRSLFIEITVTHENEPEKVAAIRAHDQPAIEIVLTALHNSDKLYQDEEIRKAVFDPANAHWINHPKAMERVEQVLAELELKAEQNNRSIQLRLDSENRRVRRKAQNIENAKQRLRDEIKYELEWLGTLDNNWIKHQEQQKENAKPTFLKWVSVDKYSDLVGYSTDIDWIFECKREYWQALIVEQLYHIGVSRNIKVFDMKRFVQKHVRVNANMQRLNTAQYQARQKAKANNSQTNKRVAWYLTKEENRKIISPFKVIVDYFHYLEIRGVLTITSDSSIFLLNDQSFEDFRRRINNKNAEIARYREECQRKEYEEKLLAERKLQITAEKKENRIQQMIEADTIVFSHYSGYGLRCKNCQFTSPKILVIDSICPKCNQKADFVDLLITSEYLDTVMHRYHCSAMPQKSLERYP